MKGVFSLCGSHLGGGGEKEMCGCVILKVFRLH